MEAYDNEKTMNRAQRHAADLERKRIKRQARRKSMLALFKLASVLVICLACVTYLVELPESSAYFTSQGQSESHSIDFSEMQPMSSIGEEAVESSMQDKADIDIRLDKDGEADSNLALTPDQS